MPFFVTIEPFDGSGNYTGEEIEITDDIVESSLSTITQKLDRDDFNVGIFSYGNITFTLRNNDGKYSDVNEVNSIFDFKRSNSRVRIYYSKIATETYVGWSTVGEDFVSGRVIVFEGFLKDDASAMGIDRQIINFNVLSNESRLSEIEVDSTNIANDDLISSVYYNILNVPELTDLFTVDIGNISVGNDFEVDDVSEFQNKTIKEVFNETSLHADAILRIEDGVIYITPREAQSTVKKTFYGFSSYDGIENIINITKIRTGLNKIFNLLRWQNTTLRGSDSASISVYGTREKSVSGAFLTDNTKRETVLNSVVSRFSNPKRELQLTTPFDYSTEDLKILDLVSIDYPSVVFPDENGDLALYGLAEYDVDKYPEVYLSLVINVFDEWLITGSSLNLKNDTITYSLEEKLS